MALYDEADRKISVVKWILEEVLEVRPVGLLKP